jgi:putative heme transporter
VTATLRAPQVVARPVPAAPGTTPARRWGRGALIGALIGAVVVVVGVEVAGIRPTVSGAFSSLVQADRAWLLAAVVATAASMSAFARGRRRLLGAAGVRVPVRSAVAVTYVANAVHVTLPGGAAFSTAYTYRWMRHWGASGPAATWTLVSGGLLSSAALAALALLGSLLVGSGAGLVPLAVGLAAVAAVGLAVRRLARRPGFVLETGRWVVRRMNVLRRRPAESGIDGVDALVAQLGAVRPSGRDWAAAGAFATANWAFDAACLAACATALGVHGLTVSLLLLTYTAGKAASQLSLLPGGLGVVDAALVLTLVGGGIPTASAVATVLLYRLISLIGVVAVGWVVAAVQGVRAPVVVA